MPLTITIPNSELFNEETCEFIPIKGMTLKMEHSLVSISKWESKWKKPFLKGIQPGDETIDYLKCMTITQNVDPLLYLALSEDKAKMSKINQYIDDPMTATTITHRGKKHSGRRIITSELVYSWMISLGIPIEFQKWHFNRLMTLIEVCQAENEGPKKMSEKEIMQQNAAINAARKAKHHTHG